MKRILTIFGIITLLSILWALFIRPFADAKPQKMPEEHITKQRVEDIIIKGKWMCHDTIGYKTLEFNKNGTFTFDSIKQRFPGHWKIMEDDPSMIHLSFTKSDKAFAVEIVNDDRLEAPGRNNGYTYKHQSDTTAGLLNFYEFTGFANAQLGNIIMILVGLFFIFLAIKYDYEPLLLIPIGTGIIIGNIPFFNPYDLFNLQLGIYQEGSVMNYLYFGVTKGIYPPLIFLGIGAMTDFSSLISNPRLMLLGAAAQVGIFITFLGALILGFYPPEAGAIGIIGGADGPTAIFLSSKLANGINQLPNGETVKNLIGPIAIAAYSYMALVPVIQPPIMRLLTSRKERLIRMKPPRAVSKLEKIMFPIIGLLLTAFISPSSLPLLGTLFFGNLLKESGVTKRLADTARTSMIDIVTILLGLTVGASTQADVFITPESILIFILGALSFMIATAGGLVFAKVMNLFLKGDNKINPLIGAAGVSAVPDSARVVQNVGLKEDPTNHLLMHAMAPNVSGVIGSAVAAGILLSFLM